jgi:hypothetical protein
MTKSVQDRIQAAPYNPQIQVTETGFIVTQTDAHLTSTVVMTLQDDGSYHFDDGIGETFTVHPDGTGYSSIEFSFDVTFG